MRVVIDSNMLESDELRVFLQVSDTNLAVLTDFAWIEAYKHDPIGSIQRRLSVLKDYPDQIVVLKGAMAIAKLDARAPGIANRMIRPRAKAEIIGTFQALDQAAADDVHVIRQILDHSTAAQRHMKTTLDGVPDILGAMPNMQGEMFTKAEIDLCRTGADYTREMISKILGAADQIADTLFQYHKDGRAPTRRSKPDTFLYRYSLATVLYVLRWIREGSQGNRQPEKVRNDFIDLIFSTTSTYFNGLMSDDFRARDIHHQLRSILEGIGGRVPNQYIGSFISQLNALKS